MGPAAKVTRVGGPVGYVMSRFPHLPETFILREMDALVALGWDVRLYPLMRQRADVMHPDARPWVDRAQYLHGLSLRLLSANARFLLTDPVRYLALWAAVVRGHAKEPAALVRALVLLPACVRLAGLVRRDGVRHVHAHYATYPLLAAWVAHRLVGVPYSVTVHAHDIFLTRVMLGTKLADAAFVVSISQFNSDYLAARVDAALPGRTHVVHCGVEPGRYGRSRAPRGAGAAFELLSTGSLQEYKGQRHLVEACRLLRARGVTVRCRIVGGGPEREALQAMIDQADLRDTVLLLGPRTQDEVTELLGTADCYVQPSVVASTGQMEGIPVALMEALAAGLPVVATDLSGVPELVRDGSTGWLVAPADAAALADALAAVHADPDEATRRGAAGRALVAREFDLHTNVARLSELLAHGGDTVPVEPAA